MKANLKKFWENPILWNQYNTEGEDYKNRLVVIKNMIPLGIKTVVDVGCGMGDIIKEIDAEIKIALDISETALRSIKDETIIKIVADITEELPITKEIDLIICLEVLEHLPENDFKKAIENLLKMEPRFILIGVPYKEPLERRSFRCNKCGQMFNVDTHFRSFNDKKDVIDLFKEKYTLCKEAYVGHIYPRLFPAFYLLKNRIIGVPDKFAVCYHCGNDKFTVQRNKFSNRFMKLFVRLLEKLFSFLMPRYPYWMLLLLEYKEGRI
jgi:SAM-dependent methyltransferase